MMAASELKAVDDWSFGQRIRSRGEAIRQLIQAGGEIAGVVGALPAAAAEFVVHAAVEAHDDRPPVSEAGLETPDAGRSSCAAFIAIHSVAVGVRPGREFLGSRSGRLL